MDDLYRFDIIDFGSQYTHLISKKLRRAGFFSLIHQLNDYTISDKTLGIPAPIACAAASGKPSNNEGNTNTSNE